METISGQVTEEAGAHGPIAGVTVCASAFGDSSCGTSNAVGFYLIADLPPGTYRVAFDGRSQGYVGEFYDDEQDWEDAEEVTLLPGADRTGVDAQLAKGGTIEGVAVDAVTKAGLGEVEVCAWREGGGMFGFSCSETGPSGAYAVSGLPDGSYRVEFRSLGQPDYVFQTYNGKFFWEDAALLPITGASTVSGVNAELERGGQISGTVTSAATGTPLGNIFVCALEGFGKNRSVECELTDGSGRYTLAGLPSGSYKVEFSAPSDVFADDGYPTQYYNLKSTLAEAETVTVTASGTAVGIDARLGFGPAPQAPVPAAVAVTHEKQKPCRRGYRKKKRHGKVRCVRVAKKHTRHRRHSG